LRICAYLSLLLVRLLFPPLASLVLLHARPPHISPPSRYLASHPLPLHGSFLCHSREQSPPARVFAVVREDSSGRRVVRGKPYANPAFASFITRSTNPVRTQAATSPRSSSLCPRVAHAHHGIKNNLVWCLPQEHQGFAADRWPRGTCVVSLALRGRYA